MAIGNVLAPKGSPGLLPRPIISGGGLGVVPSSSDSLTFNPARHLVFQEPNKVHTMKELGFPDGVGVSPVAVSEPFPLFSTEAVEAMRAEILSDKVWSRCRHSSDIAACQLRGFAPRYAPFVYDAWKDPNTLASISKVAGIDLIPNMDYEIAHINLSVKTQRQMEEELTQHKRATRKEPLGDLNSKKGPDDDESPVVGWHYDSYPFVCVLMLSDASTMIGGETALRTGTGDILKVRGPQIGSAVVLQGRYIEHQALRALGATERITMVTSFRPRSSDVAEESVLTTVRPISDLSELYYQFSEYRLEILEERIRNALKELRETKRGGKKVNTKALKGFLKEQEAFIARTNNEIIEEEYVTKGHIAQAQLSKSEGRRTKRSRNR